MKTVLVLIGCLLMATTTRALDPTIAPSKNRPFVGMTMDHARSYYGRPYHSAIVDGEERWYYFLKFSEVYGRAFVPFRFDSDNVHYGSITFGPDKKVKSFDWNRTVLNN